VPATLRTIPAFHRLLQGMKGAIEPELQRLPFDKVLFLSAFDFDTEKSEGGLSCCVSTALLNLFLVVVPTSSIIPRPSSGPNASDLATYEYLRLESSLASRKAPKSRTPTSDMRLDKPTSSSMAFLRPRELLIWITAITRLQRLSYRAYN
jgi:hypothetical protein